MADPADVVVHNPMRYVTSLAVIGYQLLSHLKFDMIGILSEQPVECPFGSNRNTLSYTRFTV
jgi:hypothetical protein